MDEVNPERSLHIDDLGLGMGNFPLTDKTGLLLRRFSPRDMDGLLRHTGLTEHLKHSGYSDLVMEIHVDESSINHFRVYNGNIDPHTLLIDLQLSEGKFMGERRFFEKDDELRIFDMVIIEWISAMNPVSPDYEPGKPQLPGQAMPGLGILSYMFKLLYVVSSGIFKDGFMNVADHMHASIMYSKGFKFFDPEKEGSLRAILRDLNHYTLSDISWGSLTGSIIEKKSRLAHTFTPSQQIFPISERLIHYFSSKKYRDDYNRVYKGLSFFLDYEGMMAKKKEILRTRGIEDL